MRNATSDQAARDERTIPTRRVGIPVRALRLVVVSGPDLGISWAATREPVTIGTASGNDLVLSDRTVSGYHVEIRRREDLVEIRDLGSTNGTRVGAVVLREGAAYIAPGTRFTLGRSELEIQNGDLGHEEIEHCSELGPIRTSSPEMQRVVASIVALADRDASVLLLGESGTGKELLSRMLHEASPRASHPFVTVDCAALPPTLFASELFGHEQGAFTGALRRHVGALERAGSGTVFLDEIGELPAEQQAALLGAIERRTIRRVGGSAEIPIRARFVAATHRDLRAEVNRGTFRLDLYYRIAVVLLRVPPLRERRGDIPGFVAAFLREEGYAGDPADIFPPEAMAALMRQSWPGNVRELRNVVSAALAIGPDAALEGSLIEGANGGAIAELQPYREARAAVVARFEREYASALLERTAGNVREAARVARMDRSYLIELLDRHGLRNRR